MKQSHIIILFILSCFSSFSQTLEQEELFKGIVSLENMRYKDAFDYFSKAAYENNDSAQFYLGFCYEFGLGVERNNEEARRRYRDAAAQGMEIAYYRYKELTEKKNALIIVNEDYDNRTKIPNALNDALGIARSLRSIKYNVSSPIVNIKSAKTFKDTISTYLSQVETPEYFMLYYIGHSNEIVEKSNKDLLLEPTGIKITGANHLNRDCVSLMDIVKLIRNKTSDSTTIIVIVDSERTGSDLESIGNSEKNYSIDKNTILLFSTQTDNGVYRSLSGIKNHSPFSSVLINTIDICKQLTFNDFIDIITTKMEIATDGRQIPQCVNNYGNFWFSYRNYYFQ